MKRFRGWVLLCLVLLLCAGGVWLTLRVTAEYPPLGEPVSYPVNQIEGFELTIETPTWSPFKGYSIHWDVAADSEEVYYFKEDGFSGNAPSFEYLERSINGQWYRLGYLQEPHPPTHMEFALGGSESTGLGGSIVQKYADYGTRLEAGTYRVVLEMHAQDGTPHYLAAEFEAGT